MKLPSWLWSKKHQAPAIFVPPSLSDEQIINELDPWTLACAVGAENGSCGVRFGFDCWLEISAKNWLPKLNISVSKERIFNALRKFVEQNKHRDMREILSEESVRRGKVAPLVIEPGKSVELRFEAHLPTSQSEQTHES